MAYLRRNDVLPWIAGISAVVAILMGFWAVLSPESTGMNGLVLLAGIAVLLFVLFYGLATGSLVVGKHNQEKALAAARIGEMGLCMRVLDDAPEAYLIVNRSGAVIYANHAYEDLTLSGNRGRNAGRPLPLEQVFAGDEALAAPLYRMARGARTGQPVTETLTLHTIAGGSKILRATVSPIEGVSHYALYRITEASSRQDASQQFNLEADVDSVSPEGVILEGKVESIAPDAPSLDLSSAFFQSAPLGLVVLNKEGEVLRLNDAAKALFPKQGVVGGGFLDLFDQDDRASIEELLHPEDRETDPAIPLDVSLLSDDTTQASINAQIYVSHVTSDDTDDGETITIVYIIDTTERMALELQMAQSQKMQAVGQLAGGVAHDFNNLLTAIIGFCDLLLARHEVGDPSFGDIDQIRQNANRAANLVRQLLAFSRQQTLTPKVYSPTDVLTDLSMLLRRLLGETIELKMSHGRNLGLIKVDQSQLDTALINLAVNARDAMSDGGQLTIDTSKFTKSEGDTDVEELITPGAYVLITVTDTGSGIPEEVLGKIFEPFFTTKGVGEGTGLGLSTVYGIIKQMGGFVFCDSKIGDGTTFRIYLPVFEETEEERKVREAEAAPVQPVARDLTGVGTILLVEDEDAVRAFANRALTSRGYSVLEAANGVEALEIFENYEAPIDLMVSDVVMPEMDGPTLANKARALKPDTKIIFISGYAEDAFKGAERPEEITFLPKPFSLKQLAAKVKEVLEE